ncbi:MAG: DUF4190 domain-containing protein [Actinomycetes bacterium]
MSTPRGGGRTPGIAFSALVFALLGFACAVPAVVGLILGLVARPRAKEAGAGVGLATAAIAVSAAWLVLFAVLVVMAIAGTRP